MLTSRVWLCACVIWSLIPCLSGEPPCRTARSVSGMALVGHSYRAFASRSIERCVFACEADPACFSLNFYSGAKFCELSSITKEWFPPHLVPVGGALYMESVARGFNPSCTERATLAGRCGCLRGRTADLCEHECIVSPLGMEDGRIPNNSICASAYIQGFEPPQGRLRAGLGWRPYNHGLGFGAVWFQIQFAPKVVLFTHVATQGGLHCFVKRYYLAFLTQVFMSWRRYTVKDVPQVFAGNTDTTSVVKREIQEPFKAVAIRIHPQQFEGCALMRMEVYGCFLH